MFLSSTKQEETLKQGYDINCWISDRSGRKSSVTQETLFEESLQGRPFILLRNKKDEIITEQWLSEYVVNKYKDYTFFTENINPNIACIKYRTPDNEVMIYCYGLYVSLAQKYKSNYYEGFEKVRYIVWEECIPNIPLIQQIRHIRTRCMNEINNVLSIGSTVARGNKVQYIWLGNDIKENILNPVTIGFNLLERLERNVEITDTAVFNDREYTFYFNYFDFSGAVNHWLYQSSIDLCNRINVTDKTVKYDVEILTEFKKYSIYNCGSYIHISDYDYIKSDNLYDSVKTPADFFKRFSAERLYIEYPITTALTMLATFNGVPLSMIERYFGKQWYKGYIDFREDISAENKTFIDLEKVLKMPLSDILMLPEYNEIKNINEMRKSNVVTYSNIKIKMLFEELANILLLT